MAYNEVTLPQWQQLVRRVFGLTGPGGNIPTIAPEITPVVVLQPHSAEFRKLRNENLWSAAIAQTSGAAVVGGGGLVNPVGSGVLVVIERIALSFVSPAGVAQEINVRLDSQVNIEADLPAASTEFSPRDTRLIPGAGTPFPAAVPRTGQTAAPSGFFLSRWIFPAAGTWAHMYPVNQDIILTPGFGVAAFQNAVGVGSTIIVNFDWYERFLEPAELNG